MRRLTLQSLAESNYKKLYCNVLESPVPCVLHEVFAALRAFLTLYARRDALRASAAEDLVLRLQKEVEGRRAQSPLLEDVARVAQHIWSSGQRLKVPAPHDLELCSILNKAIRLDDPDLLAAAMPLIRSINSLCVVRGARPDNLLRFPSEGRSFRGTGVPEQYLGFFKPGLAFRVPGFLATSFEEKVIVFANLFQLCNLCCFVLIITVGHSSVIHDPNSPARLGSPSRSKLQ